jgi:1-acyl-sn-glycerol-3-phosphate acyltransferase
MTAAVTRLPPAPTDAQMNRLASVVAPLERITQPKLYGLERLPERGALFVGNHTLLGLVDVPFMEVQLWRERAIRLRGLGDHGHYAIPVWRNPLEPAGMVRGARENARALMRDGQHILVFPGGTNEMFHGRGHKYELRWKERLGFARLAIEFRYPIIPFAAIGVEEMFDIVADQGTPGLAHNPGPPHAEDARSRATAVLCRNRDRRRPDHPNPRLPGRPSGASRAFGAGADLTIKRWDDLMI